MIVTGKVVLATTMAFSFVIQMSLICSANAYPDEDFFFTDQPQVVHKRAAIERKKSVREEKKMNARMTMMTDMDTEGGGSGVGPDEASGVDPNEENLSGIIEGSGDDTTVAPFEINGGTEPHRSTLPGNQTETLNVTGLTEHTLITGNEAISETPTTPSKSTSTLRHGSSVTKETSTEVPKSLAHSTATMDELSATHTRSSQTDAHEYTETLPSQQITTQEEILNTTKDLSQLSTLSQTASNKITEESLSTQMTELSTITIGTNETEPLSKLVSIQVCGKLFYCLAGRRGPCPANEILVEDTNHNEQEAPSYCSALFSFPWRGCLSSVNEETASATLSGRCNLKSMEKPCSGLPSNYRYHPISKSCRPTSEATGNWMASECGDDQIFIGLNQNLGSCVCLHRQHLIYTGDNQCYHPYTRGPCNTGMWLTPSSRREMDCRSSPCKANEIDGRHFYWKGDFHGRAGCYRTNTRGPCPEGKIFTVDDNVLGHARCEFVRFSF